MPESKLPYINAYGNIKKALGKIQKAETPDRFSHDFLESTLGMTGGGARSVLPYLKRTGFLNPDGTPTALYRRFRNSDYAGGAAAEALRIGYAPLFAMEETVWKQKGDSLKNLILQATGLDADSGSARNIVKSFEALNGFAKFSDLTKADGKGLSDADSGADDSPPPPPPGGGGDGSSGEGGMGQFRLGYTINLNLPATSDAGVYNAIFRSLRENLLRDLE